MGILPSEVNLYWKGGRTQSDIPLNRITETNLAG